MWLAILSWILILLASILYVSSIIRNTRIVSNYFSKFIGYITGFETIVVFDKKTFGNISNNSNVKGYLVEHLIAKPRWYPLLSIESEDGENWRILHKLCFERLSSISLIKSVEITKGYTRECLSDNVNGLITCFEISEMVFQIFFEIIFDRRPTKDEISIGFRASIEWKKNIAMKGDKDNKIVVEFMAMMGRLLMTDDIYIISSVAQPFLISPQINIPDIMVEWKTNPHRTLDDIIESSHPFPLLERFHDNKQYIYWMDKDCRQLNWGLGPRKCIGRNLANQIITQIFRDFLPYIDQIHPIINHQYSGRNNDNNLTVVETGYQILSFLKILYITCCPHKDERYI